MGLFCAALLAASLGCSAVVASPQASSSNTDIVPVIGAHDESEQPAVLLPAIPNAPILDSPIIKLEQNQQVRPNIEGSGATTLYVHNTPVIAGPAGTAIIIHGTPVAAGLPAAVIDGTAYGYDAAGTLYVNGRPQALPTPTPAGQNAGARPDDAGATNMHNVGATAMTAAPETTAKDAKSTITKAPVAKPSDDSDNKPSPVASMTWGGPGLAAQKGVEDNAGTQMLPGIAFILAGLLAAFM